MMDKEQEHQYQTRVAFERDGKELQYRLRGDSEWKNAHWSHWEWDRYDYRIKPEVPQYEEVPVLPLMSNGVVMWVTKDLHKNAVGNGATPIIRFVTRDKVRHAVVEVK